MFTSHPGNGDEFQDHEQRRFRLHLKGLIGSSHAFVVAAVYDQASTVQCVIMEDQESAAYFYNDLENLLGEKDLPTDKKRVL